MPVTRWLWYSGQTAAALRGACFRLLKICNESGSCGAFSAGAVLVTVIPRSSQTDLRCCRYSRSPMLGPETTWKLRGRAPPFDPTLLSLSPTMTRVRYSHGTRRVSLTVASFRTWRGWQVYAAWDPAFNIIIPGYRLMEPVGGRNSTPL